MAPSQKAKFEQVAQSMHPDLQQRCKGFLRHKDVLISPSILRQYNVEFQQVCRVGRDGLWRRARGASGDHPLAAHARAVRACAAAASHALPFT